MSGTIPDTEAAIAGYLIDEVGSLVNGRVFRPELPTSQNKSMPRAAIVVRPAGGYVLYGASDQALADPRVDVICYGATRLESQNIARAVLLALKHLKRQAYENTLLHWAHVSGVVPLVDPDTAWNYCVVSAQVLHGELTLT